MNDPAEKQPLPRHGSSPVAAAPRDEFHLALPVGIGAFAAAIASMAVCYGLVLIRSLLDLPGLWLNPHVQSVLMWSLGLLAVLFLWRDRRHHTSSVPLTLGAAAVAMLIGTLYLGHDTNIEALAYTLLVVATLLNQNFVLGALNRTVGEQAEEIAQLNADLAAEIERQRDEISRLGRLKPFLAPQVAELVVAGRRDALLNSHRRYVACLFCDIRGFTAASEAADPEDVIALLQRFHDSIGALVAESGGTIGFRSGDGLMVFFNDPIPCDEPVREAAALALSIRTAFASIRAPWAALGQEIGIGIGIASGHVTLGLVGFQGGGDYTAIGSAVNQAARLCDAAADGQILLSRRARMEAGDHIRADTVGEFMLKGFRDPVEVFALDGRADGT